MDLVRNEKVIHIALPDEEKYERKNQKVIDEVRYYVDKYPRVELLSIGTEKKVSEWNQEYGVPEADGFDHQNSNGWCNYDGCKASIVISDEKYKSIYIWGVKRGSLLYKTMEGKYTNDVQGIKRFRNGLCIETLLAHEFMHAIDSAYQIYENSRVIDEYEKHAHEFEDIHEFIAECYTVSEFVEGNKYADKIRVMIDEIIENNN